MTDERCDATDLPVEMCHCKRHGGAAPWRRQERVHPPVPYDGPRPPKDAILISVTGIAHHYGCDHLPDYDFLLPPRYGWIEDPSVWGRIGIHEVRATGGNTARVATRRCLDCDW